MQDVSQDKFTVLTYNIRHGKGMDDQQDLSRIKTVLADSQGQLIGLQEVDGENSVRAQYVNQSEFLANALQMSAHFSPAFNSPFLYGNTVLSSFPVLQKDSVIMPKYSEDSEARSLAITQVMIQEQPVTFISTHLGLAEEERADQVEIILQYLTQITNPVIVVGDWNAEPNSLAYTKITEKLVDVAELYGKAEPTFPASSVIEEEDKKRIDYIFVSPEIRVEKVEVIHSQASDHLPLKAVLRLSQRP